MNVSLLARYSWRITHIYTQITQRIYVQHPDNVSAGNTALLVVKYSLKYTVEHHRIVCEKVKYILITPIFSYQCPIC